MGRQLFPTHESVVVSDGAGTRRAARRGLSPRLWAGFPLDEIFGGPNSLDVGFGIWQDFVCYDFAVDAAVATVLYGTDGARGYTDATGGTGVAVEIDARTGGRGVLEFKTTTDNEEVWLQWGSATCAPFLLSDTSGSAKKFAMEVRFQVNDITTNDWQWFIGLCEEGVAVNSQFADNEGGIADTDLLGLLKIAADTSTCDVAYNLSGHGGTVPNNHADAFATLVADTWYNFGFIFDPSTQLDTSGNVISKVRLFWQGVEQTSDVITHTDIKAGDFPDGQEMAPLIGIKGATNHDPVELRIDYLCAVQMETDL